MISQYNEETGKWKNDKTQPVGADSYRGLSVDSRGGVVFSTWNAGQGGGVDSEPQTLYKNLTVAEG